MSECIFCQIVSGELPSKKAYENEDLIAFHDISPKAPVHVLVVPRMHIATLSELREQDCDLAGRFLIGIKEVAERLGIEKQGYKVIINNGRGAGQVVFHLHAHILSSGGSYPANV